MPELPEGSGDLGSDSGTETFDRRDFQTADLSDADFDLSEDFDLSDDFDSEGFDSEGFDSDDLDADDQPLAIPVVAVVGRPNVGKSTLVNRILGRREAVVQDIPGVTRDRVAYDAYWGGRQFTLVDTGGWEPDAQGLQAMVSRQAEQAVVTADLVLFVVDSRTGATETDLIVARTLRRAQRPVVLAVTKIDDERGESDAA